MSHYQILTFTPALRMALCFASRMIDMYCCYSYLIMYHRVIDKLIPGKGKYEVSKVPFAQVIISTGDILDLLLHVD